MAAELRGGPYLHDVLDGGELGHELGWLVDVGDPGVRGRELQR